ncbi:uncharacterized protein LOC111910159 isoform X2 [Lactuca sativa]|uniref:uncharacterized protein LOC111910159 isoform X2 n=1 Tax=Lactuca sativa TaxID=4236 RepID=UPI0022AEF2AE|nr:uncharacterized protein LOC111910159 isoform X2 [Lactuca sativa]
MGGKVSFGFSIILFFYRCLLSKQETQSPSTSKPLKTPLLILWSEKLLKREGMMDVSATGGSSRELSPEEEMLIIHSTSMAAEPLTKGKGGHEVGLLLWNSRDAIFSLFEELLWVYKLVSPLKLGMAEATRVCNALALVQRPLVLKFTLWISSLTVERFNFTEGTQPDRRYLVVFMMVIS